MPRSANPWSTEGTLEAFDFAGTPLDAQLVLKGPNGTSSAVAVEERDSVTPRTVLDLISPQVQRALRMGAHLPWIDDPPFFLHTMGAERNPAPRQRGQAQLGGAKAGRLIRLLMDVRPPYGEEVKDPDPSDVQMVITGSFAAAEMMAPIAAPALLLAYCEKPQALADEHGLLRSEEGART